MRRFFKTYLPFSRAGMQMMLAYRSDFFFHLIGEMLMCIVMYFVWLAVFESSDTQTFMGFSMTDMTVYLFISFVTSYLTYSEGATALGEEIRDGSIVMRMIKPVKFDMTFLFQELGGRVIEVVIALVPMCAAVEIYKYCVTGSVMFDPLYFLLFIISTAIAYLVSFYFNVCYGFTAFFLKNLWGANVLKDAVISFLSGAKIPLAFMPPMLQSVLMLLPFASLSYTPVMIYMGMYDALEILWSVLLQLFWLFALWALSKLIWRLAVKRLCVQGG